MTNYLFTLKQYDGTAYTPLYPETLTGDVYLDATARGYLNLSTGATLSDGLIEIAQNGGVYQVGDVLITARTGLGDKWLLLNGAKFTSAQYPELSQLFNPSISTPTLITSAPSTNEFTFVTDGKPGEILATYGNTAYSTSYPFTTWSTTTASSSSIMYPAYDTVLGNYYTAFGSPGNDTPATSSSFYPYYGTSFDNLTQGTSYIKGLPMGFSYSNNKLYALSWQRSSGSNYGVIFEKSVSGTTFTDLNIYLGGSIPNQSTLNYFKMLGNKKFVICTQYGDGTSRYGNSMLYISGLSFTLPRYKPAVAMNSSKLFVFKTKTSGSGIALSIVDPTASTLDWVESNITSMGTYQSIVATDNIAWATVSNSGSTTVYQSVTADFSMWQEVDTIADNIRYSYYDSTNNKLFFISPMGAIYSSTVGGTFSIPTYSPATGDYAYIKAKK